MKLSFYCTPGRLYRVQRCSSLSNPRWETVKSLPAGTAGRVTVTDDYRYQLDDNGRPILLSNMYYRVGARLE